MNAAMLSEYRAFPRAFSVFYLYCGYEVSAWFMLLPDPSIAQSNYAMAFAATAAAWFKFYVEGGK